MRCWHMNKGLILPVIRILLSLTGLVSLAVCIAQPGENQVLLWLGLMCNSIAFILYCIANRKKK